MQIDIKIHDIDFYYRNHYNKANILLREQRMQYQINTERLVQIFMDMAAISSPSFYEKPIMDYIEDYLKGKKVELKRNPYTDKSRGLSTENVIIRMPATDPSKKGLFFDAHADTVNPCEKVVPIRDGNIIKSDGTSVLGADDKCGIASMLIAIDTILENDIPHGELVFIVSSAEEVGLVGAGYIAEEELEGLDYGIILDGGGAVGMITRSAPFHYTYEIQVIGKASHAAVAPEKGINSIKIAAEVICGLPSGRIGDNIVCNVGTINGGTGRNVVPECTRIVGEVRAIDDKDCQPLIQQIKDAVAQHKDKAVDISLELTKSYPGYSFDESSAITQFVAKALEDIGIKAEYEESCGGTNANVYTTKGISCTVLSVGMEEIHSVNEFIRIKDLEDTTRLLLQLIQIA